MTIRSIAVDTLTRPPDVDLVLPGSKSITNRALVTAALATGPSRLSNALISADTLAMVRCLRALGVPIEVHRAASIIDVIGQRGAVVGDGATLDVGQSGTTARFVLPLAAHALGGVVVDGHEQIRARPQKHLLDALAALGANFALLGEPGMLPVRFEPTEIDGGRVSLPGTVSSQFVSALLLSGPLFRDGLDISLTGEVISEPYIDMTLRVMEAFGAIVHVDRRRFAVETGSYVGRHVQVEPDASTASYFFAAAAISGGRVAIEGLGASSMQGDIGFVDVLAEMGAEVTKGQTRTEVLGTGIIGPLDVSMAAISDTAPTLGAIAPLASGPVRIRDVGFIRHKESDRIAAVVQELTRLGVVAAEHPDGFEVQPGPVSGTAVHTYDDHRIAMAFTILGLVTPGIEIEDPQCVAKTFPEFFDAVDALRAVGDAELAVIALDGPAGSGKSTVARLAAQALGLEYLDTGAMYRSVTWAGQQAGLGADDEEAVAKIARHIEIDVGLDVVTVDGKDVTADIRTEAVNRDVSVVAANGQVRAAMRRQQRAWARRRGGGVLEGRDIGSVVFPHAKLKVFVTASPEERARRRAAESGERYEDMLASIQRRDALDSGRADSPMFAAVDATIVDNTEMSIPETVEAVVRLFAAAQTPESS